MNYGMKRTLKLKIFEILLVRYITIAEKKSYRNFMIRFSL